MTDKPRKQPGRLRRMLKKPWRFGVAMGVVLGLMSTFVLLDTFVLPRVGEVVDESRETVARSFLQAQERALTASTTAASAADGTASTDTAAQTETASAAETGTLPVLEDVTAAETAADAATDTATSDANASSAAETDGGVQTIVAPQPVAASQTADTAADQTAAQAAALSTAAESTESTAWSAIPTATAEAATLTAATAVSTLQASASPLVTDTSYQDENVSIQLSTYTWNGTTFYVADVKVTSAEYLTTAFAGGMYGRNIKATTSAIAADVNAILAINGDYYGFRDTGYVVRNGVMYRDTAGTGEALVIDVNGNFSVVKESEVSLSTLMDQGAWQVFSFGPGLVINGEISVSAGEEVGRSMASNPRTAIGQIGENHYVLVVSDGRTSTSEGFSLLELAEVMQSLGCITAYNLDGGGSSTMVFMGTVVNQPTTNGRTIQERTVSDIVAIV